MHVSLLFISLSLPYSLCIIFPVPYVSSSFVDIFLAHNVLFVLIFHKRKEKTTKNRKHKL